jgi:hypothetical protein
MLLDGHSTPSVARNLGIRHTSLRLGRHRVPTTEW